MRRTGQLALVFVLSIGIGHWVRAQDDPKAVLDKAIKAAGGEEKLAKAKILSMKTKGKINFGGMENELTSDLTYQAPDHLRTEFEGGFGKGSAVLSGDKGWSSFQGSLDKAAVANEKQRLYLQFVPLTLVPLKDSAYKLAAAAKVKVDDKDANGIKVTAPDGKDFSLYFDAKTSLPVLLKAKTTGFMGEENDEERTYSGHKEMGGITIPTKIVIKHGGETFFEQEVTEFKVLDKVDAKLFEEPK